MANAFFTTIPLFLVFNCVSVTARNYSITYTASKLRTPTAGMTAMYDGNDAIYLLGGAFTNGSISTELFKYNIETDTIEIVASNVVPTRFESAILDSVDESIYIFGGRFGYTDMSGIWNIPLSDPDTPTYVGDLPNACSQTSSIWNQEEYIYIIGGHRWEPESFLDTVVKFSKCSNVSAVISKTPTPVSAASAVRDPIKKVVYVFGGSRSYFGDRINEILMFNETSGVVTKLDEVLPNKTSDSCAVSNGGNAFIVGGRTDWFSLVKFDFVTHEVTPLFVENFSARASRIACTWVESLNRIYIFGGDLESNFSGGWTNAIMYIDMSETNIITTIATEASTSYINTSDISISTSITTTERPTYNMCDVVSTITTEQSTSYAADTSTSIYTTTTDESAPNTSDILTSTATTEESTCTTGDVVSTTTTTMEKSTSNKTEPLPSRQNYLVAGSVLGLAILCALACVSLWILYQKKKVIKAFGGGVIADWSIQII